MAENGPAAGRISGQPYGEGERANELLRAARGSQHRDVETPGASSSTAVGEVPGQPSPPQQLPDVFAPTERPDEPITEGAPGTREPIIPEDPHFLTRVFATLHPSTELLGMLDDG